MIKEVCGLYENGNDSVLAHVAQTPAGIIVLPTFRGPLNKLAEQVQPAYHGVSAYYKKGCPDRVEFSAPLPIDFSVVSVLPSTVVMARTVKLPPVGQDEARIKQIIDFEAQQNVPFPISEVSVGYHVFTDGNSDLNVMFQIVRKEIIEKHMSTATASGITPSGLVSSMEAMTHVINQDTLLYTEGKSHNLLVFRDGIYTAARCIPIPMDCDPARMWGEINRSRNVFRAQDGISMPTRMHYAGISEGLAGKLRENGFELVPITHPELKEGSIADYAALGAALSGLNPKSIDLLRNPPAPTFEENQRAQIAEALVTLKDILDGAFADIMDKYERK